MSNGVFIAAAIGIILFLVGKSYLDIKRIRMERRILEFLRRHGKEDSK